MMSRGRATISCAPSVGYHLAARRARPNEPLDLSTWRVAGVGGEMVKTSNLEEFAAAYSLKGFRSGSFLVSYGMAELTLGLTFCRPGQGCRADFLAARALERGLVQRSEDGAEAARSFAVCGVPLPGHEVEIRDETGQRLGEGLIGRVFASGPSMMQGYFGDSAGTLEVLSADGWLDTGDMGYLAGGELVVTGRSKDLIIVNGRNIWPQDLEWALERSIESLREGGAAAFRIDAEQGERVGIVIQTSSNDQTTRGSLSREADRMVRQLFGLAAEIFFSRPGLLPRTSSGKLSRAQVRELHRAGRF
jgi:fatty-acyl-CoA synthase